MCSKNLIGVSRYGDNEDNPDKTIKVKRIWWWLTVGMRQECCIIVETDVLPV